MKPQPRLAEMIKGQMFDGFLLTRTASQRTSANGNKFLDMTLCDLSGELLRKVFSIVCADTRSHHRNLLFLFCRKASLIKNTIREIPDRPQQFRII